MKMAFKAKKFGGEALELVTLACEIISDYEDQGYKLSLRQLYYQLVARNAVPNTEQSYDRVGTIIAEARMAGLCDWDMIEDRGRECVTPAHWNNPGEIVEACANQYRIDKWADQPVFCEVMVEKQALEGVLEPVCNRLDIPFTANKGYSSVTMMYHQGRKLREEFLKRCRAKFVADAHALEKPFIPAKFLSDNRGHAFGQWMVEQGFIEEYMPIRLSEKGRKAGFPRIVVFYLGDHDPSGIDMTRDVADRLCTFSDMTPIEVRRLALNMDQIEELNPPENPAKLSDSRARKYIERFGESSWELDAVSPEQLATLVTDAVQELREETIWAKAEAREKRERATLQKVVADLKAPSPKKKK
jgi:hypothetical protein